MTDETHSVPLDDEPLTQDVHPITEPLGALVAILPHDPLIADLIALRRATPDLAEAARSATFFEAMVKVSPLGVGFGRLFGLAQAGLQLLAAANEAIVAIWPVDDNEIARAKLSLHPDPETQRNLRGDRYLRVVLAALHPGYLRVSAPAKPTPDDRALVFWPVGHEVGASDAATLPTGDAYGKAECERLAMFAFSGPKVAPLIERARELLAASDQLRGQAMRLGPDALELRLASEGALISAYSLLAQAALWPSRDDADDIAAKVDLITLVNSRVSSDDPTHMIATVMLAYERSREAVRLGSAPFRWRHPDVAWSDIV
ncbi:hypothetical protein [Bosea sp. PAMC 26642]|uniref:hypothetical protein n=1 Tax=Bosea sp. (strain PAMC 26642) TaxID=1792307 RepID=UPI0007701BE6|nr:hypothetical protein [Bosea sp. PAMC 26642]AMJ61612.1 hypothetical protein AXW83_16010 [Bosea sp. PAMC 26642]